MKMGSKEITGAMVRGFVNVHCHVCLPYHNHRFKEEDDMSGARFDCKCASI